MQQVLDLTGGHAVSAVGIASLAACAQLRSLALTWCIRVGDAGLVPVAAGCRKLELLSLHGLRLVTDRCGPDFEHEISYQKHRDVLPA